MSGFVAWFHLLYFGLALPIGGIRQWCRHFGQGVPMPSRLQHFRASVFSLSILGGLSVVVAVHEGIDLFPKVAPSWTAILSGLFMRLVLRRHDAAWRVSVRSAPVCSASSCQRTGPSGAGGWPSRSSRESARRSRGGAFRSRS